MKKLNLLALSAMAMSVGALSGCSKADYTIGVLLPVRHEALQLAEKGFVEALKEAGLVEGKDFAIKEKNADGDEAALNSLAKDLVSSCDMTLGTGTGASQSLQSAAKDGGSVKPILFTAVTDPVGAKLVEKVDNGSGNITGASDAQPVTDQIALIKEILPEVDKIGVIYSQNEQNSVVQKDQVKAIGLMLGIEVVEKGVSEVSEISPAAEALAATSGLDAIYVPTDNKIAANMNAINQACNSNHVLAMCGEFGEVETGGHISFSFDYEMLGKETGKLAYEIIKNGKSAAELPVQFMTKTNCEIRYSSKNLAASGIELPESVKNRAKDISLK